MKNFRQIFLLYTFLLILFPLPAFASEANVVVHTNSNFTNSSTSISNSHTHIKIETNGVVKECDSDNGDCTHMESDDGTSKVEVDSDKLKISPTIKVTTITPIVESTKSAGAILERTKKEIREKEENWLQKLEAFFKNFFEKFKFKLY